jgi:hypothetical protein
MEKINFLEGKMKRMSFLIFFLLLASLVCAESRPFEVTKNSYDPFVAESRGFESLFVNPAGMAGQTQYFTWDTEAGTQGKRSTYETIQFLMENSNALSGDPDEDMTEDDAIFLVELLVKNLDQGSIDLLTNGLVTSGLQGMTADEIIAFFDGGGTLTLTEIQTIETNVKNNQDQILEEALGNLEVVVEFTMKLGTLFNGFGLGLYANVYSLLDAGVMGFETLIMETGLKSGYGINLGPFALGLSGDIAMLGDVTYYGGVAATDVAALSNQMMVYGIAWGLDVGAIYQPFDWFTVGAVMTDIIGCYSPTGEATVSDFFSGGSSARIPYEYQFDSDIDVGVTFTPRLGRLLRPSFSADYYNIIELFRTPPAEFQDVLDNLRLGAHIEFLTFINVRAQYYQEYFTLGAGVDLAFFEIFGEFLFKQTFDDLGGAILMKLHF